jgi:CHAT domain-containing protein/tetratricopeptide (TPR) repeat protein
VGRSRVGPKSYTAILVAVSVALAGGQESVPVVPRNPHALLVAGQYEAAEAEARKHVDSLRATHGNGALQVAAASDVLVHALFLNGRGPSDDTVTLARQTLIIKETWLGPAHADLVPSLVNLGDVLVAAAQFDQAVAATTRAVALCERIEASNNLALAEALDRLGSALSAARRHDDALKALEGSLSLKEKMLTGADPGIARTLEEIGLVLQRKGDYELAGVKLRRAATIQEAVSIDHPAYARTMNLVAQQLWFEGNLLQSRKVSERAVEIAERTLRPDHPTVALALRYLAATLADLGDFGQSLTLKRRALEIANRNFGANHHVTGEYLHSLGLAELDQGDYSAARRHFQQALDAYETRYGRWHEYIASVVALLAEIDANLGDYANARREQSRALAIRERIGGLNHPLVAMALTDLARIYREEGAPEEALRLLERALAIREAVLRPQHRDVARTLADLASALMQIGRTTRAQALAGRALTIWEQLDAPHAPEYATVLALYAEIQRNLGNLQAAKEHYERALRIWARVFGISHPSYAEAQSQLALTFANLRETSSALSTAVGAEATGRDHLRLMLRSLPERQALNYAAGRPRGLHLVLSMSDATPDAIPFALDGLIRSRALVLDEVAARQTVGHAASEQPDSPWVALRSAQQRLANLMVRGPGLMSPSQYMAVVEAARRESERAEQALAERSAGFRAERSRAQIGLAEVRASLPAESALVSFVRYERSELGPPPPARASDAAVRFDRVVPSYMALVLPPSGHAVAVPLGTAAAIDALVREWRRGIAAGGSELEKALRRPSRVSGAALRKLVWDPIARHIADARRVFVVPDGTLNLVPLVALPIGQTEYLLENGPILHYLSAERDLVPGEESAPVGEGFLAVGGPSFDDAAQFAALAKPLPSRMAGNTQSSGRAAGSPTSMPFRGLGADCPSFQSLRFEMLPASTREVNDIAKLWKEFGPDPTSTAGARPILTGSHADEKTFKRIGPGRRVLHLATHGFFLGGDCTSAREGTRAVGGLVSTKAAQASKKPGPRIVNVENPLLLSGLAMAGANHRAAARADEEDGILTAEEVASLNLEGTEWAVLSACDTGLGEIKAGEGVFGLRRAFQIAGARTVIMSLWSVEDRSAMEWMRALYEGRLRHNLNTADAVREASLTVLRQRRARGQSVHPFYWAGFVASGDWR